MRLAKSCVILVPALLALLSLTAHAQAVVAPVQDNFDDPTLGFELTGWTTDPPSTEGVAWAVDATPATIGPTATSSTFPPASPSLGSLNYNDGTNYEDVTDGAVKGSATSPVIDITGLGGSVILSFATAFQVETYGGIPGFDVMTINVLDDTSTVVGTITLGDPGSGAGIEIPMGTWTSISLDASGVLAGSTTCQIQFVFASGDSLFNAFSGWFVDNFSISCLDTIAPPAVTNLLPPDTSIVTSPVTFDWTDSADTSPCGTGIILGYTLDIDDDPAFGSINFTTFVVPSTAVVPGIPVGTWFWRVTPFDTGFNAGPSSTPTSFTVEVPLPPLPPDTLFVNIDAVGAQNGDPGFVDPVIDETPHFSAIYRDPNTVDFAIALHYQVSTDPTFVTVDFDSGNVGLAPTLPKDARCSDLLINVNLVRNTTYFWRIQCTDASGATGPFSLSQSFRIGDDFEFGVRHGSTHHGKRCYVATAAFGEGSREVAGLSAFRSGVLEAAGAGRIASRAYATAGAAAAQVLPTGLAAMLLGPASHGVTSLGMVGLCALTFALMAFASRRLQA